MTTSPSDRVIRVVAGVVTDDRGRVLLVRKTGTDAFMQPGGKLLDGESAEQALAREMKEELGCRIKGAARRLGRFAAPAANEPGWMVDADLFALDIAGEVRPDSEIAEAVWHDPADIDVRRLAPLTSLHVLPMVRAPRIWL